LPPPTAPAAITLLHADATLPAGFVAAGNHVFFVAGAGGSSARRLWISDGTPAGTRRLHDSLQPAALQALGSGVAFTARNPDGNQHALWHASTTGAVRMLRAFRAQGSAPSLVGVFGSRLYFIADDTSTGRELWSTDGTSAGTRLVADLDPDGDARFEATHSWTWFNGRLHFIAARGRRDAAQLYATNGSAGDLRQLTFGSAEPRDLSGHDMAVFGNRLYFTWHSRDDGVELWRSDGSVAGTQPFFDALPGRDRSGSPRNFNVVGGRLLFFAYYPGGRTRGLFATNGSASGTAQIAEVEMSTDVPRMVQVNGRHLFPGRRQWDGAFTLWATDGSATGTIELGTQVSPAAERFDTMAGTALLGSRLVFLGRDAAGYEPWITDGTRSGTLRLADLNPGPGSSFDPRHDQGWIAARGGKAYFTAAVASDDFRLFETDGTAQGTQPLAPPDATVHQNTRGDGRTPLVAPFASGGRVLFGARFNAPGAAVLFGM
jgi:ELWxxDGT repeat protein